MEFTAQIKKKFVCDVLVVGGGVAGFSASVSASRCGMNVILAEQGGYLGGTATAGLVAPFMTCYDAKGKTQIIRGIFKETIDRLIQIGGAKDPSECRKCDSYSGYKLKGHLGTTPYDKEKLKIVLEQMCQESGVTLKYHFMLVGVNVTKKRIRSCVFATNNGFYEIEAKQFIDCTGDANLCYLAGGEFEFSDENNQLQPVSTFMLIDGVDKELIDSAVLDKDARGRAFMDIVEDEKKEGRFPCGTKKVRLYEQMNGVWAVIPRASIPAPTSIEGRSVALRPDPITYAPAEKIIRCQGISTSFHLTTPTPGRRAMIAPIRTTTSAETPCQLSVTHMMRTPRKIAIDLYSSSLTFPIDSSSSRRRSIPP
jgi:hypothetical protein